MCRNYNRQVSGRSSNLTELKTRGGVKVGIFDRLIRKRENTSNKRVLKGQSEEDSKPQKVRCVRCGSLETKVKATHLIQGWICERCDRELTQEIIKDMRR